MAKRQQGKKVYSNAEKSELLDESRILNNQNFINSIKESLNVVKLTQKQVKLNQLLNDSSITTILGPAGTSKTFISIYAALWFLIENKKSRIILCKPIVEAGEKLGFLPGEKDDKIDPYLQSYLDIMKDIVGEQITRKLFETDRIVFEPLGFLRGRNFKNCFVIVDEAQNYTMKQLMTVTTRKHTDTKMIFCGDSAQNDLTDKVETDLDKFVEYILPNDNRVGRFKFIRSDIKRDKILIDVMDNYERYLNTIR